MKLMSLAAIACVSAGLCGSAAAEQPPPSAPVPADTQTYQWAVVYKKGDVTRYRGKMELSVNIGGNDANIVVKTLQKLVVKDVSTDGTATIETSPESSSVEVNGMDFPAPEAPMVTIKRDKNGAVIKADMQSADGPGKVISQVALILLNSPRPTGGVKIGDTWKSEVENAAVPGKKFTATSTLVGKETLAGIDTMQVRVKMSVPLTADATDKDMLQIDNTYNIDPKNGRLVALKYKLTNLLVMAGGGAGSATGRAALIVPGVNDKEPADKAAPAK